MLIDQLENAFTNTIIPVKIYSLSLQLYNNSDTPFFFEVNDDIEILVDFSDFDAYLIAGMSYQIDISVDPNDMVNETNELNNQLIIYGVNYNPYGSVPYNSLIIIIIVSSLIILVTLSSLGGVYVMKKRQL
ncbi:MAG: hypothetical protein ACFFAS_07550 [Promethearchaeota archaeon]